MTSASSANSVDSTLPIYLTVGEVASLLRRSPKAVYALIDRGQLPGVRRVTGRVLVHRAQLLEWIESSASSTEGSRR
jgi:excisionase family DNA binding protein